MKATAPLTEQYNAWRREVEEAPLPANLGEVMDLAVRANRESLLADFFEIGESLTVADFEQRVNEMAGLISAMGVAKGSRVAVLLKNRPEFPVTWFALAKLGAVMVPMNTRLTTEEIVYMADDAEVTHAVIDEEILANVDISTTGIAADKTIVFRGDPAAERSFEKLREGGADTPDYPEVSLDDLASIQYTSGTTGLPKGALLTHRYWVIISKTVLTGFPEPPKRVLSDTPFFYLDPQFEFIMVLMSGSMVSIAEKASLSRFIARLRDNESDYCAFWENALSLPEDPRDKDHGVRWVSTTGLPGDRQEELQDRFGVIAREMYGSTEAGAVLMVPWEDETRVGSGSCGITAPFREAKIVGAEGEDLGPDQVGELVVRGDGMFLGYNKRPEVNAELIDEDGWFRTGDLMKRDSDGFFYFIGRIKDMIRRSHENISAVEVQDVFERHPSVKEAAAVPVPDDFRGEEVKVILVSDGEQEPDPAELIEFAREHLATFKVPRYIEFRTELPKTASGKIAKARLKAETDPFLDTWDREAEAS